jgi:pimeloyl-ACP methyl ester carboxylesterase
MKKLSASLFAVLFTLMVNAQMVSYTLQESFTIAQLDSVLSATGFALPISPQYDIEVYQVIYKTPYRHIDSLVNASGIVVFPKNKTCPSALGCYAHGTFTKRVQVPSYEGPERPIGLFFAGIGGVVAAMPDELGMGDSDSSVIIHPYINGFHSGYASVNMMRAARQLADTLGIALSGEVVLTGYSQGGYTTMATNKLIQENFSSEFNVVASAPMSGPYDLNVTMVDVMLSFDTFAAPSYLPYLLLGYYSVYPSLQQLYPNFSDVFKSPYDSILPPLYYSKLYSTGDIDQYCHPVPRMMIQDSAINAFANDLNHPLRQILAENDLLGWVPQNPVKIHYCTADRQVSYLNAIRADSTWNANGAPDVTKQNFGNLDHGPCVEPSLSSAAIYILGKLSACTGVEEAKRISFQLYPNPSSGKINILKEEGVLQLSVYDFNGKLIQTNRLTDVAEQVDLGSLPAGFYVVEIKDAQGRSSHKKLMLQ